MYIIVKKPDRGIFITKVSDKKYGANSKLKRKYSNCKDIKFQEYKALGYEWYITGLPIDKSNLESRKQLMWEDVDGKTVLKKDEGWNVRLMPDHLIKRKHLTKLNMKLEEELNLETPDPVKVVKLKHEIDTKKSIKADNNNEKYWSQIALQNIIDDGISKPNIKKMLEKIVNEA